MGSGRSYAILGTGALGGYYGSLLQRAGLDVHFLAHGDIDRIRRHGLLVESKNGDFKLPHVKVYADPRDLPPCDVAIVALKTTHNRLLPSLLPHAVNDGGVALVLQNGLGVEEAAADVVGDQRVLGGLCFLCSNKVGPGHIRHLDYGQITLGEFARDGTARGVTGRLSEIAGDLTKAGIPVKTTPNLFEARWRKLVWNVPYNGLSVVLDASTAEIMGNTDTRALAKRLMLEVIADAGACGAPFEASFAEEMLGNTDRMAPYETSMKLDYEAGRPMEIEAIFGAPLRMAEAAGKESPLMRALYEQLRFLDGRVGSRAG